MKESAEGKRCIWIMAGESSGEAYGALLAERLWEQDADLVIRGMGATAMSEAGVDIIVDSSDLGIIGLVEVLKHYPMFRRIFWGLVERASRERPDAVVLIDYPGFNLRFAKQLHKLGITVIYYISPQVWAWGKRRIPVIAEVVDKMLTIFPFEPEAYAGTELDVEFVGHPLLEVLAPYRERGIEREESTVLLLPGSRRSEVDRMLPVFVETSARLALERPDLNFVVAVPTGSVSGHVRGLLASLVLAVPDCPHIGLVEGETREWLCRASVGIAASGTVTVEAAILGLPLVVAYRLNVLTFALLRRLVKIPYFTMVNLVAEGLVYPEFLQGDANPGTLSRALVQLLPGEPERVGAEEGMALAVSRLAGRSDVCKRAAQAVIGTMEAKAEAD